MRKDLEDVVLNDDEVEENKIDFIDEEAEELTPLEKYNANLTPKQRKENALKAAKTRRKNNLEKKVMSNALSKQLSKKVKTFNPNYDPAYEGTNDERGQKYIYISNLEAIVTTLVKDAIDPDNKNRLDTTKFIFEKMEGDAGKGKDVNVNVKLETLIQNVTGEKW